MIAFAKPDNIIAMPTKSNEWYTPARYVEAAREVMGGIDLDPASCKEANMVVRASKFYSIKDNGLEQPWFGNVWLNPPYGKIRNASLQAIFVRKLLQEWHYRNIEQAILLCTADMDELWFQPLSNFPIGIAYPHIHFYRPGQSEETHIMGSAFVYLGSNEQKFIDHFQQFGPVYKRVSVPKERPVTLSLWGDV